MLEKLLTLLQDPHTYSLNDLAHALDTSPEMVETMLENLERMGYVRQVTGCDAGCPGSSSCHSSNCQGCSTSGSCTPANPARTWALVEHH